jgi:uncharacterized flavoprotein (TIGR03862 family)
MRHRWLDWDGDNGHRFATAEGERTIAADAVVFALGGGSWSKLGSDGAWLDVFARHAIAVTPLQPSNCGFAIAWSGFFRDKFAGAPVKPVTVTVADRDGNPIRKQGELVITEHGVEGSVIYAVSVELREQIRRDGHAQLQLDLLPHLSLPQIEQELAKPHHSKTLAHVLQNRLAIKGVKSALLREVLRAEQMHDLPLLARTLKHLSLTVTACRPLDEAISSAGGVCLSALDENLMLHAKPGVFCAGEMLDWEAPTGGYLLTACFATGYAAGLGVKQFLKLK